VRRGIIAAVRPSPFYTRRREGEREREREREIYGRRICLCVCRILFGARARDMVLSAINSWARLQCPRFISISATRGDRLPLYSKMSTRSSRPLSESRELGLRRRPTGGARSTRLSCLQCRPFSLPSKCRHRLLPWHHRRFYDLRDRGAHRIFTRGAFHRKTFAFHSFLIRQYSLSLSLSLSY
jgi:hypothetical protein